MIVMVANQTNFEFGYLAGRYPGSIGHLYSPGAQRGPHHFLPCALDNGAYVASTQGLTWDAGAWRRLLLWAVLQGAKPLWAVVPDVVAKREATIARWHEYVGEVRALGLRPAFAVQDGMTFDDVPDSECMLFIGGTDDWKDAAIGPWCSQFPGRVHIARVNGWERLIRSYRAGAVSVDGSGWWHKTHKNGGQRAELVKFIKETHGVHIPGI